MIALTLPITQDSINKKSFIFAQAKIDHITVSHINATGYNFRTFAWNSYIILAGGPTSQIFNLTCVEKPTFVANISTTSRDLQVCENKAYLATVYGLRIFDLTNLTNPILLGENTTKGLFDIIVKDNYAFVTTGGSLAFASFAIANVSDATKPFYESFTIEATDWSYTRCLALKEDLAYFAGDLTTNLYAINISNPKVASIHAITDLGYGPGIEFAIYKNHGYMLRSDVLNIYDLTESTDVELVAQYELEDRPWDVCVEDDTAYIALNNSKLLILDVKNPQNPVLIKEHQCKAIPIGISFNNGFIFLSQGDKGVEIVVKVIVTLPIQFISLNIYTTLFIFLPVILLTIQFKKKRR